MLHYQRNHLVDGNNDMDMDDEVMVDMDHQKDAVAQSKRIFVLINNYIQLFCYATLVIKV